MLDIDINTQYFSSLLNFFLSVALRFLQLVGLVFR